MLIKKIYEEDTPPDFVWSNVLLDVEQLRKTADAQGLPHDPEWTEWELEAKANIDDEDY